MIIQRIIFTASIMLSAVKPPASVSGSRAITRFRPLLSPEGFLLVLPENQRLLFADLTAAVNSQKQLKLYFQNALVLAAPVLLFRLKRQGFSCCRTWADGKGVYLTGIR